MTNLDSILKSRDITLPTKVRLVKAMVLPVVMYGCENWTVKKAEHWRIDAFELWCWRRLLRVPWTARRSNQSILKEISPGCSFEGLTLKLDLQYFGHLMRRADLFEKTLMLGKSHGRRRRGQQRGQQRWLDGVTDNGHEFGWTPGGVGDGQGGLVCCISWGRKELDTTEPLNWTEKEEFKTPGLWGWSATVSQGQSYGKDINSHHLSLTPVVAGGTCCWEGTDHVNRMWAAICNTDMSVSVSVMSDSLWPHGL